MKTLYEDRHFLAVSKPAGMVVHPTYKNKNGTLLDALTSPALPRPSIVGRLDKWTSGIVLVARSSRGHAALQRAMAASDTEKIYLALVAGDVDQETGRIEFPLQVDVHDRRRVIVAPDGSPSVTCFERLATFDVGTVQLSLLRCRPLTGRRHQIRVHLAARGWPIVADPVYGRTAPISGCEPRVAAALSQLPGQALHACRLNFHDPFSGRELDICAPVPDNFDSLLTLLSYKVIL